MGAPDEMKSLRRMQDELTQMHQADLMDTMDDSNKRKELEIKDLEAAQTVLKKPSLTLDQFLDLYIPGIKGLTEDQKKGLIRLQEEEEMMHKKDLQDAMEDDDKRQEIEQTEMDLVRQILGRNISEPEFLKLDIDTLPNLKRPEKAELKRLQKELKQLSKADKADDNEIEAPYLTEEEALLKKASDILGSPIELIDLLGLEVNKLTSLTKPDKLKLKEIQDRLAELHKNDLGNKQSRREIEMDDLSKARSILNQPELTLEELLDLDISKIKNLLPSERKELIRIQNELKLAHQADLKDAMENANDRKNLEKAELKAAEKILGEKVNIEDMIDLDLKSLKDIDADKLKE